MSFLAEYDRAPEEKKTDLVMQWIGTSSHQLFAELRESRPVLVTPGGPVVVTRYPDVQEVLSREKVFSVRLYGPKMDPCVGPYMLARDATGLNERDKSVMRVMLRREDLPRVRETVARLAARAVDGARGRLEVVGELSRRVPIELCGEYFGFPGPDLETMKRWARTTNFDMFFNDGDEQAHRDSIAAGGEMKEYVDALIGRRRAELEENPGLDDILSRLLKTTFPDGIGFDDERIRTNVMFLLIGGVETTSGATVLSIDELLRRPQELAGAQAAARAGDDALLSSYVWEALRLNPIFPVMARYCETDYTLASGTGRETRIPAGATVLAAVASAMHDAGEVEQPDAFRLDRPEHHLNLHFGYGHHLCLCYYLSLVEVPETIKQLLRREGLRRAPGAEGQIDFGGGPYAERLVVEFDP